MFLRVLTFDLKLVQKYFRYAKVETDSPAARSHGTLRSAPAVKSRDVLLDPNHNNFILVDDGSIGVFGKEIEFRAHLEAELRKGKTCEHYRQRFRESRGLKHSHSVRTGHSLHQTTQRCVISSFF